MAAVQRVTRRYTDGFQLVLGSDMNNFQALRDFNSQSGLIAKAGGGQASAVQLFHGLNDVATVASANDSFQLPSARPGGLVFVNQGAAANDAKLFTKETTGVNINGTAGATGITLTHAKRYMFFCVSPTDWWSILGA